MRDAVIAARAALPRMREQIGATERELEAERRQLMDAARRGRLAGEIGGQDTVAVGRHRGGAEAAGRAAAARAGMGVEQDGLLKSRMDRAAREAAAEQQLESLE